MAPKETYGHGLEAVWVSVYLKFHLGAAWVKPVPGVACAGQRRYTR